MPKVSPAYKKCKRALDLSLAWLALLLLSLPLVLLAVLVWASDGRPVLYWSDRVGKDNQLFKMPKFRTMRKNTPAVATHLLAAPEQHLIPLGAFLRRTSLDELPQLWSILKGDMAFVGPRPALFNQGDLMALRTACGVSSLLPGLTGWAQINGRDELSIEEKVKLDTVYLQKQSLGFDLQILGMTFLKVIQGKGVKH